MESLEPIPGSGSDSSAAAERVAIVTLRLPASVLDPLRERLRALGFRVLWPANAKEMAAALEVAEIAWIEGNANDAFLSAPRLRWLHCGHAGLDGYLPPALLAGDLVVTSAAGRSAPALAEYALFLMMALSYDDAGLGHYRRWRQWLAPPPTRRRALFGRTVGIIGLGHSGGTLGRYAKGLGMRVLAWRRRALTAPESADRVYSAAAGDVLSSMLAECEFLVLACPLNDATHHLIGARELAALRRGAFVVNIGRGALIDERALIAALKSGHLGGAGLDVFETEPLPPESPLWSMPQVLISPHRIPRVADREARHGEMLAENLRRFAAAEPLLNRLGPEDALTPKGSPRPRSLLQRLHTRARWLLFRLQERLRGAR